MKMFRLAIRAPRPALFVIAVLRRLAFFFCISIPVLHVAAQDADYIKIITERSSKIVNTLNITDSAVYKNVVNLLVQQYAGINSIDEKHKAALATLKASGLSGNDTAVKKEEAARKNQLSALHTQFLTRLKAQLSSEQVEKIKDGITYNVLPITWKGYQEMIPRLTEEEKQYIYAALVEARELAMDAGSSKEKHGWFGKYKGRINNYLSARGYDMKKESEEWAKRVKEKQNGK